MATQLRSQLEDQATKAEQWYSRAKAAEKLAQKQRMEIERLQNQSQLAARQEEDIRLKEQLEELESDRDSWQQSAAQWQTIAEQNQELLASAQEKLAEVRSQLLSQSTKFEEWQLETERLVSELKLRFEALARKTNATEIGYTANGFGESGKELAKILELLGIHIKIGSDQLLANTKCR